MAEAYPQEPATVVVDRSPTDGAADLGDDRSLGELISEITTDMSLLMRQEVELAKAELKEEAVKAGKGAGAIGAGGFLGYLAVVVLTFAAVFGLAHLIGLALGAVVVGGALGLLAAALLLSGRAKLRRVAPTPERTVETLKEDARWARHPTS